MKLKNIKINNRGFVILFAVTIAGILLAIALGVENIAFKELRFTTSAKNSNDAFFAADTGAECALMNNKTISTAFIPSNSSSIINCNSSDITVTEVSTSVWQFNILNLGSDGQACAKVTVDKTVPGYSVVVTSDGYNFGDSTCSSSDSNRVERELEVSY